MYGTYQGLKKGLKVNWYTPGLMAWVLIALISIMWLTNIVYPNPLLDILPVVMLGISLLALHSMVITRNKEKRVNQKPRRKTK